ncbi:MAG: hypothetical protein K2H49_03585 [Muribaculaceae bacterium]|nr:hypothetical protein [Muribaculaceae bacterium]
MRLLLFNPETEYALASGASFYTPPASVEKLRKQYELLPEAWAEKGDYILVEKTEGMASEFNLVEWNGLSDLFKEIEDISIEPWGWNHALIRRFADAGVPARYLPDESKMDLIRRLAHRRTTVRLNSLWNDYAGSARRTDIPVELKSEKDSMEYYRCNNGCWMKAPWSSSGRGVINTGADMTEELVRQWCHGIIRRQGSVMGETGADRIADFATEWKLDNGNAEYIGLSSFATSGRGKYLSNHAKSQSELKSEFDELSDVSIDEVINIQKEIIEEVFEGYDGPLGVDMIVERNRMLRPFVEVNLRRTMGMLYIQE